MPDDRFYSFPGFDMHEPITFPDLKAFADTTAEYDHTLVDCVLIILAVQLFNSEDVIGVVDEEKTVGHRSPLSGGGFAGRLKAKAASYDRTRLQRFARDYGTVRAKKFFAISRADALRHPARLWDESQADSQLVH